MKRLILKIIAFPSPEKYQVGALYIQGWRWSTGYNKSKAYGDHAEDVAVKDYVRKYGEEPQGGTMYCTLSPCSRCTKTINKYKMKSVYVHKYTGKL